MRGKGESRESPAAGVEKRIVTFADVVDSEGEERERLVGELISRMTLDEKIAQMSGGANLLDLGVMVIRYNLHEYESGRSDRLGIPPIKFTDGPRGVAIGNSTCFPVSMARGATWDTDLEERVGRAMGIEARAQGANFFGGVCVNLLRHPGWGRAQETFGDDPYLLGEMGAASVRGLQEHVMACAKHYACNSIEDSRFYVDVRVDERTLREIYLPHFKRCVDEGVASIMSAYNRVNGFYCAHNSHLLRDILKGDWGFEGFVISDFVYGTRGTVEAALGGLDIEMPNTYHYGRRLKKAVLRGDVPESVVDEAVSRIIRQKARFARVGEKSDYDRTVVGCREHTELALEAARKSMVLLKNENDALPLRRGSIRRLAVIGELAALPNTGDRGSSQVRPPYVITPLQGIRERAGSSCEVLYDNGKSTRAAVELAGRADVAVVVAGLKWKDEGEGMPVIKIGGDRTDLGLPRGQEALIRAVADACGRCVVVLEGGSAITMESWKGDVDAIMMAWYPGMEGGYAVAEVLFGDVNPSGKLPIIFPESSDQLPPFDTKAKTVDYGYYHGYRLFDREGLQPAFPFGFGLSYTDYGYSDLRLSGDRIDRDGNLGVRVDVTNRGGRPGEEVVQLYVGYPHSRVDRPVKELKGFARVPLEPGETRTVSFEVRASDLAYYDPDSGRWQVEETEYAVHVGSSSRKEDLVQEASFTVSGP